MYNKLSFTWAWVLNVVAYLLSSTLEDYIPENIIQMIRLKMSCCDVVS